MSSNRARADDTGALDDRVLGRLQTRLPAGTARRATVADADREAGTVVLSFGCGCSGGLTPQERALVRTTLVEGLEPVERVLFRSGCGCGDGHGHDHASGSSDEGPEAPF